MADAVDSGKRFDDPTLTAQTLDVRYGCKMTFTFGYALQAVLLLQTHATLLTLNVRLWQRCGLSMLICSLPLPLPCAPFSRRSIGFRQ